MECVHSDDGGGADGEIRYGFTWAISHLLPEDPDNNQNSHIPSFWRIDLKGHCPSLKGTPWQSALGSRVSVPLPPPPQGLGQG